MNDDILVILSDPEGSGLYNKVSFDASYFRGHYVYAGIIGQVRGHVRYQGSGRNEEKAPGRYRCRGNVSLLASRLSPSDRTDVTKRHKPPYEKLRLWLANYQRCFPVSACQSIAFHDARAYLSQHNGRRSCGHVEISRQA